MITVPYRIAIASLGLGTLALSLGLWTHYGTVVFFDAIAAGFAACF